MSWWPWLWFWKFKQDVMSSCVKSFGEFTLTAWSKLLSVYWADSLVSIRFCRRVWHSVRHGLAVSELIKRHRHQNSQLCDWRRWKNVEQQIICQKVTIIPDSQQRGMKQQLYTRVYISLSSLVGYLQISVKSSAYTS